MKVKELIKLLEETGWEVVRRESSHQTYKKQGTAEIVTVSGKLSDEIGKGLLAQIKRKAGLD